MKNVGELVTSERVVIPRQGSRKAVHDCTRLREVALGVRHKIVDKTPTHEDGVRLPKLRVKPNTKAMRIQIPLISRSGEGGVK